MRLLDRFRRTVDQVEAEVPVDPSRWIQRDFDPLGPTTIYDLDGVAWLDAPVPPCDHRCTPQTWGYLNYFTKHERCACGAISRNSAPWCYKNSRRP